VESHGATDCGDTDTAATTRRARPQTFQSRVPTPGLRRALYGALATCQVGGAAAAALAVPSATAASDPCAASEIARTIGSVATSTGNYLDTHPDTNAALTAAAQQPGPQAVAALKTYFDANTQAGKDIQAGQQPLQNLSGRCRLPITLPQILQFMQAPGRPGSSARAGIDRPLSCRLPSPDSFTPTQQGAGQFCLA
jgi:heme-binding protein